MDIHLRQVQKVTQVQRIQMGIALSHFIELSQKDFKRSLKEVEESELFKKLSAPGEERVIEVLPVKRYFPSWGVRGDEKGQGKVAEESRDESPGSGLDIDLESLLEGHFTSGDRALLAKIRSMGVERFCYYFLEGEGTEAELASLLDISPARVKPLRQLFDRVILADVLGLQESSSFLNPDVERAEITAEVRFIGEEPQIDFANDRFRYRINESALKHMTESGRISPEEMKELRGMKDRISMINYRFNLLHEIIMRAVEAQKLYLRTLVKSDLKMLEEQELAGRIGIDPSWICRLVRGKSSRRYIQAKNHMIPLRDLFVSGRQLNKQRGMHLMASIIEEAQGRGRRITDEEIQGILKERHGIVVGRRAVNNWRREVSNRDEPQCP